MAQVYHITDEDVVLVDAAGEAGASSSGETTTKGAHPAETRSSPESDPSPYNKTASHTATNSHASHSPHPNPNSHAVEEEELAPSTSSSPRTSSRDGDEGRTAADVKMESMDMDTDLDGGGHPQNQGELSTRLPNLDTSDPVPASFLSSDDQKPSSSTNDDGRPSVAANGAKTSPSTSPTPAVNGVAASIDEKSKKPASTTVKPRSKRRSPSPETVPPPPAPRLQTIRLEIPLGGPENYAVDIVHLAKETGQRPPTPPTIKRDIDSSESEGEGAPSRKGIGKGKGRGKVGRRSAGAEYYDLNDPFIDDSELAIDERTYFAQTKQQGFYVSSGEVALLKDKSHDRESRERDSPKKPKSKRTIVPTIIPLAGSQAANAAASSGGGLSSSIAPPPPPPSLSITSPTDPFDSNPMSTPNVQGTRETPITLSDTEDNKLSAPPTAYISTNGISSATANGSTSTVLKRKASENSATGKKKRKTVEIESFHPELQLALYELKQAISQESFEQKGKFPPALKPILARVALKAIAVGEYNDNFFALMPKLFIYNKYTMTKLIKRTVYADHQKLLLARQDELIEELRQLAEEGFEKAKEEHEKSVQAWERRQEKSKPGAQSVEGTPAPGSNTPSVDGMPLPPLSQADGGADSSMEVDGAPPLTQASAAGHGLSSQHPPSQRFKLTERMKNIIWELVVLSNESVRIENEKNQFENSTVQVSEQGTRKVLYQKIVAAFPEGWMSSGQISREVSVMKKRYEAQQAEGVS